MIIRFINNLNDSVVTYEQDNSHIRDRYGHYGLSAIFFSLLVIVLFIVLQGQRRSARLLHFYNLNSLCSDNLKKSVKRFVRYIRRHFQSSSKDVPTQNNGIGKNSCRSARFQKVAR